MGCAVADLRRRSSTEDSSMAIGAGSILEPQRCMQEATSNYGLMVR
jgi:hypothetical protein